MVGENAPPPPDWSPEPHYCADLDFLAEPDFATSLMLRGLKEMQQDLNAAGLSRDEEIPPLVVLGEN